MNGPAIFQCFITFIFCDLPFVFCYIDDILVFSTSPEEHTNHLRILFQRLNKYGLSLNLSNSKVFVRELDFLGHTISAKGFKPTSQRIEFFKKLERPRTV